MKGIILAGGSGSRLHPITNVVSKQLLPIYNKPMIYYPISTLISSRIRDILIITKEEDQKLFQNLLGDGSNIGCKFSYAIQEKANGLAEAFIIGEDFIGNDDVALILGDNIFHGNLTYLLNATRREIAKDEANSYGISKAAIFGYNVYDPERYGVVEINKNGNPISIEEKPKKPKSNLAIPGLYFFTNDVINISKTIEPSQRGELEITSVINSYLQNDSLIVKILPEATAWLDTGTFDSFMQASAYVETIEKRQGILVGSIEATAYHMNYINKKQLNMIANQYSKNNYGKYLLNLSNE